MAQKFHNYRPVKVLWEDFAVDTAWHTQDMVHMHLRSPYLVESVGFMLAWNKKRLILAVGIAADGQFQDLITIPRGMVHRVAYLGECKGGHIKKADRICQKPGRKAGKKQS